MLGGRGILSKQYSIPSKCGISSNFTDDVILVLACVFWSAGSEGEADEVMGFAWGDICEPAVPDIGLGLGGAVGDCVDVGVGTL